MLKEILQKNLLLSLKILAVCLLGFANLHLAMADVASDKAAADAAKDSRAGYAQFDVSKYLTVGADDKSPGKQGTQDQGYLQSSNPVASFILQIINLLTLIAASFSFFAVVVGGFFIMSAAGNDTQMNKGKDIITRAIVGLVLTLTSYFIVSFVQNLFFESAPK